MSKYRKLAITFLLTCILLVLGTNAYLLTRQESSVDKEYRVDVERIVHRMEAGEDLAQINLQDYPTIVSVEAFEPEDNCPYYYVVKNVNGELYRFSYEIRESHKELYCLDLCFGMLLVAVVLLLLYLDGEILRPFYRVEGIAKELAKGNLTIPIKQERGRYLKDFLWSLDMLRQKLEDDRTKEYALIKENKTMVLALSHDIKTPLSAMDLYAKALSHNLYDSPEEKQDALQGMEENVVEIKGYLEKIVASQRDDFLALEVLNREFYLAEVMEKLTNYYEDKCRYLHVEFTVEGHENTLLYADPDRLLEVLQNVMENALKYGDGSFISIAFSEEENYQLITVSNSGEPMKEEELPHIFESFYRGSNANKASGSGLGMYIAKSLMHKMEGDIFVKQGKDGELQGLQLKSSESPNYFQVTLVVKLA